MNPVQINELSGPKALPLIGNIHQVKLNTLHQSLEEWTATYGSLYTFKVGSQKVLVSADPTLNRELLRLRPDSVERSSRERETLKGIIGTGVFNAEGDQWKRQRRFVMQGLAKKHLDRFFSTISKVSSRLLDRWMAAAEMGKWLNIQEELMRFTVDVTCNLAFGYDMNTIQKPQDEIQDKLELIFPAVWQRMYAPFPYWKYFKLGRDRKLEKAIDFLNNYIEKLIVRTEEKLRKNPELIQRPSNFLEALVAARDEEDGSILSHEEIVSNVYTMLIAGEDTTANTAAWCIYYLTELPLVYEKALASVDQVLGADIIWKDFSQNRSLSYLDLISMETLRFRPVAPIIALRSIKNIELSGLHIPENTTILTLSRAAMQYQELENHQEFIPERWMELAFGKKENFIAPFGYGSRLCPGLNLAMVEIKSILTMLIRNFEFERDKTKEVREEIAFTMVPKDLFVRLKARPRP